MNASLRHPLFDSIVKRGRRRPLFDGSRQSTVDLNRADLVRMLPHRDPMLLIDSVCSVSLSDATIHADRALALARPGTLEYVRVAQGLAELYRLIGEASDERRTQRELEIWGPELGDS